MQYFHMPLLNFFYSCNYFSFLILYIFPLFYFINRAKGLLFYWLSQRANFGFYFFFLFFCFINFSFYSSIGFRIQYPNSCVKYHSNILNSYTICVYFFSSCSGNWIQDLLLGKCSTTWGLPPVFLLFGLFIIQGLVLLPGLASDSNQAPPHQPYM